MKRILLVTSAIMLSSCVHDGNGTTRSSNAPDITGILNSVLNKGNSQASAKSSKLSDKQIVSGLKEALSVSTNNVVKQLGKEGGFNLNPKIHIPLPAKLQKVDSALKLVGMNHLTKDLEAKMNEAAEVATPKAKKLFIDAISKMSFQDARHILTSGQQDAATQYLRKTMGAELYKEIQPIVNTALASTGAVKAFDSTVNKYNSLPMVASLSADAKADLYEHAWTKTMDGIFYYIAKEEAAIRENPEKRTTAILKTVFGNN